MATEAKHDEEFVVDDGIDGPPYVPDTIASTSMDISSFSQAIFPDIPDFYLPDSDINVSYILTETISPSSKDWIGLFRVGWGSPRDYTTYVWAPTYKTSDGENNAQTVMFEASRLPGDDNEFYQFCYVSKSGYVRGASTPFQFRISNENDHLVEMEDDSGMIILKTKSDALEEELAALKIEKCSLQIMNDELNQSKLDLLSESKKLSEELASAKKETESAEAKGLDLQAKLEEKSAQFEKLTKRLAKNEKRIETTKAKLVSAEQTIEKLNKEIHKLKLQIEVMCVKQEEADEKYLKELKERDLKIQDGEQERLRLIDDLKDLSLVKEQSQKTNSAYKMEKEEAIRASLKMREEASAKMKRFKDERDLFKAQLTESEMARQEVLLNLKSLTEKLGSAENKIKSAEGDVEAKKRRISEVSKKLSDLEKKYKHETNKCQELLRNSLDRASATSAAKQLLAQELSETTATRDALLKDLNNIKQEKEKLSEDLKTSESAVHALESQLETAEEKLAISESRLDEHDRIMREERKKAEEMEREMHEQIVALQHHLEEADSAVAKATERESFVRSKKSRRTQTPEVTCVATETQSEPTELDAESSSDLLEDDEAASSDLKTQVEDLTTRLRMGADAYKEKFMECRELEKKVKKLKILYHKKQEQMKNASEKPSSTDADPSPCSSTSEISSERPQGWGSKLEKLFMAIADPDAEEKEQTLQLHQKVEELQKNLELSQGKHKRYKQLYKDEREKLNALTTASKDRNDELNQALNEAESKSVVLADENKMLKDQLKELLLQSSDVKFKNMIGFHQSSSSDELSSSPDEREQRFKPLRDVADDEMQFEDAPGVPMFSPLASKQSNPLSEQSSSSEVSDDSTKGLGKFNMCSERKQDSGTNSNHRETPSVAIPRKTRVINRQPIRTPPQLNEIVRVPHQAPSSSRVPTEPRKKATKSNKGKARVKSKKSLKGAM